MTRRGYPITREMQAERRHVAEVNAIEYAKLSTVDKLSKLPKEGAKKQRARLEAQLKSEQEKKESSKAKVEKKMLPAEISNSIPPEEEVPHKKRKFNKTH